MQPQSCLSSQSLFLDCQLYSILFKAARFEVVSFESFVCLMRPVQEQCSICTNTRYSSTIRHCTVTIAKFEVPLWLHFSAAASQLQQSLEHSKRHLAPEDILRLIDR